MAFTEAQRAALERAYVSGATSVSYDGKSVSYRNLAELKQVLDEVTNALEGRKRRRQYFARTMGHKGL